ncbi:MAG: hypothetical protein IT289_11155 [Oligoflexia bacterium]|nr:hypothetical protein [Oligoflexia bacterium]
MKSRKKIAKKAIKRRAKNQSLIRFGDPTTPPNSGNSGGPNITTGEVVLHELGESIALSLSSVQNELTKYQNGTAAFLVDEIDIVLPIKARVDNLGQIVASVADSEKAGPGVGQFRLKVRPVVGAQVPLMLEKHEPIESLDLPAETIETLKKNRIFSVDDFQRVTNKAGGLEALKKVNGQVDWKTKIGKSGLVASKVLPREISKLFDKAGIKDVEEFVDKDPKALSDKLSEATGMIVEPEAIKVLQDKERFLNPMLKNRISIRKVG